MSIEELEKAVAKLPPEDYRSFRDWFADFDMDQWDQQIEADSNAGRLDAMIHQALEDYKAISERRNEPTISHEEFIQELKRDGLLPA